ncbi:hypothetical protein mvi_60410 (plasmid) [Methylobacterium indicum]|uniref:Uncharacterized protein n=1 Tax=Methylobacterium indicum TaxID=1775910 RepID=A0A8H8WZJ6_9HYPH|nr:hypothetical protein mvi_60410 [Methylobacterium indicum]
MGQELAASEVVHQTLVDRRSGKGELGEVLGERQLGRDPMRSGSHGTLNHLVADRARLLLADLGLQQVADDLLRFVAALEQPRTSLKHRSQLLAIAERRPAYFTAQLGTAGVTTGRRP